MSDLANSTGPEDSDDALVAEFVLGLLTPDEYTAFARRLAAHAGLRAQVRDWRKRFEGLDSEFAEQAAPAGAWERIEGRLFGTSGARAGWWNSLTIWRGFAAAAFAVAALAIGFNVTRPAQLSPNEMAVQLVAALQQQAGSNLEFVAFYDSGSGKVKLLGLSGAEVPDKDYELWYIPENEKPVSMGVINASEKKEIPLSDAARAKFTAGTVLAVTLEPKGGSPTGDPTGPIVSAGPAMAI